MSVAPAARDASRDWQVGTAVVRGAAHELTGLPLQDAVGSREIHGGLALAVADGHGNRRHFRSARGAELAIEAGLGAAAGLASAGGQPADGQPDRPGPRRAGPSPAPAVAADGTRRSCRTPPGPR